MTIKELISNLWGFPEDAEICIYDMKNEIRLPIDSTDWIFKNSDNVYDGIIIDLHINED